MGYESTILELLETCQKADSAYYNKGKPIMSDAEYDYTRDTLKTLVEQSTDLDGSLRQTVESYLASVGTPTMVDGWEKATHFSPMGSLLKVVNQQEFDAWSKKYTTGLLCWSEKMDGLSVELVYENGLLIQAITRGDGYTGDDITANVKRMKGVKHKVSEINKFAIIGEIMATLSDWSEHFPGEKNPRNSAAGASRRFDGRNVEHLTVFSYGISGLKFDTEQEKMKWLESANFITPNWGLVDMKEAGRIQQEYEQTKRSKLNYEIDGIVFKDNNINHQEKLGRVDNRPRAQRAFKFTAVTKESHLRDVIWQTGRTGVVTPVGIVDPVNIGGVTVTRISLCNLAELKRLDIKMDSKVLVKRSNDVIPKVIKAEGGSRLIDIPSKCPACDSLLEFSGIDEETGSYIRLVCKSNTCEGRGQYRILHYLKSLDIKGFGKQLISKLFSAGSIRRPSDLYRLSPMDIAGLEGLGEKSAQKLLEELNSKSSNIPVPTFVKSLGIELFGESFAKIALDKIGSLEALRKAEAKDLASVPRIGDSIAEAAVTGFKLLSDDIDDLLTFVTLQDPSSMEGPLVGKSICFTGFRDKNLEKQVISSGGQIASGVSKNLDILVCASLEASSSKIKKAKEYNSSGKANIHITSKGDFLASIHH